MRAIRLYISSFIILNLLIGTIYLMTDFHYRITIKHSDNVIANFILSFIKETVNYQFTISYTLIIGLFILNIILLSLIIKHFKALNLNEALNLNHIIKKHQFDMSSKHYKDTFYFRKNNVYFFWNSVAIEIQNYIDSAEDIKQYMNFPSDSILEFKRYKRKSVKMTVNFLPTFINYDERFLKKGKMYIGFTLNGEPIYSDYQHTISIGRQGAGKSCFFNSLVRNYISDPITELSKEDIKNKKSAGVELHLCDFKNGLEIEEYRGQVKSLVSEFDNFKVLLDELISIMNERYEKMKTKQVKKYTEIGLHTIIIMVDESGSFIALDKKNREEIFSKMLTLVQKARASGLFIQLFQQSLKEEIMPKKITDMLSHRVLFATENSFAAQELIGNLDYIKEEFSMTRQDISKMPPGRCMFKNGCNGKDFLIQVPIL